MCSKADMAVTGCMQMLCGLAAVETKADPSAMTGRSRYAPMLVIAPAGRNTIPPVSPG